MPLTDQDREEIAEIVARAVPSQPKRLNTALIGIAVTIAIQIVVTTVTITWSAGKWKATTESLQISLTENRVATQNLSAAVTSLAATVAVLKDRSDRQEQR